MVEDKISNNIFLSSPVKIVWPFLILAFSWKYKITKSKCWYMYLIIIIHNQTVNKFVQKCPLHWVSSSVLFCPNIRKRICCVFRLVLCFYVSIENKICTVFTMTFISRTETFYKTFIDIPVLEYYSMHPYLVLWNCDTCILFEEIAFIKTISLELFIFLYIVDRLSNSCWYSKCEQALWRSIQWQSNFVLMRKRIFWKF